MMGKQKPEKMDPFLGHVRMDSTSTADERRSFRTHHDINSYTPTVPRWAQLPSVSLCLAGFLAEEKEKEKKEE